MQNVLLLGKKEKVQDFEGETEKQHFHKFNTVYCYSCLFLSILHFLLCLLHKLNFIIDALCSKEHPLRFIELSPADRVGCCIQPANS